MHGFTIYIYEIYSNSAKYSQKSMYVSDLGVYFLTMYNYFVRWPILRYCIVCKWAMPMHIYSCGRETLQIFIEIHCYRSTTMCTEQPWGSTNFHYNQQLCWILTNRVWWYLLCNIQILIIDIYLWNIFINYKLYISYMSILVRTSGISIRDKKLHLTVFCGMQLLIRFWYTCF